jgi:hypothetical protein
VKTEISPKAPTSSARASRKLRTVEAGMHPWCHHPAAMLAAVVVAARTGADHCSPSCDPATTSPEVAGDHRAGRVGQWWA